MKNISEQELIDAEEDYFLTTSQLRNINKIANSSLPKKKQKKFEGLVADYNVRRINARSKYYSIREKYEKQKAKAKAKKK